jgi:hypothetical protein
VSGATYDSGALIAAERGDRRMWALHRRLLERGEIPTVPAGVLGQGWRGGPQPLVAGLLVGCRVEALTEGRAREAGSLRAKSNGRDVIDASVVAGALARGDVVFTSDRTDLEALASAIRRRLQVVAI